MHRLHLHRPKHPLLWTLIALPLVLLAAVAWCEWAGWPFLQQPAERWLSKRLERPVSFAPGDATPDPFRLRLLGSVRLDAKRLQIDNPPWSTRQPMTVAHDAKLRLRWSDLLALRRGEPLQVESLTSERLQLQLERRADGAASWHFGPQQARDGNVQPKFNGVHFERLTLRNGTLYLNDAPLQLVIDAQASLDESASATGAGLVGRGEGRYHDHPLRVSLRAGSALAGLSADPNSAPVPVQLQVQAGPSRLRFDGLASDLLGRLKLSGSYEVAGPSLAEVGKPFSITLPTTGAFSMNGNLRHEGTRWHSVVHRAQVGRSILAGEFDFDRPPDALPRLVGRLNGPLLWLADLGPAVGATPGVKAAVRAKGRVLPDRSFDLPSLKMMNADVRIDLDRLEPGGDKLIALKPLRGRLVLQDGVLRIQEIDAQWAAGRLRGTLQVDGRKSVADWQANLVASGLVMERWLRMTRKEGQPPYVTGLLGGRIDLRGQGRSTAEFLASADGRAVLHWTRGTISHLVVEGAGIDIAQALGVMIRGDKPLPVTCGAADLHIADGRVDPKVLIVDTTDSTIYGDGAMSLATERLALVARVEPKDMSPVALRTPLHIDGTFADPKVSLEKGPLVRRLVPSVLLAMLNPLAGLLPLIDAGDDDARSAIAGCRALSEQLSASTRPAPNPSKARRG
ncbi:AsmA family protein [Aquincola sp. S2]|uniref:AsmA family protein n=1 Tax=Pseudaquabacterium terrae TaxID=2732868 RepID=A0ABX2EHU8_9BURK|nr:AsmA family protein [Aquabacterium terrae]NRF68156.1 AsmA family protein [Aquabacterium terrae]